MENGLDLKKSFGAKSGSTQLWVMASGKGGVGKTFITSSIGLCLSKLGQSVIVVDFDLSGANLHTSLGLDPSPVTLHSWEIGEKSLQECVQPTPYPRLSCIQGYWDHWTQPQFNDQNLQKFVGELKNLKADIVLVDLGAGVSDTHLEIFKHADERLLVTTPEPTSVEKTYRFLESYICHNVRENARPEAYTELLGTLRKYRQRTLEKPFSFRSHMKENEGFVFDHFERMNDKPIRLIVNSSRSQQNRDLGHSIKHVCSKYYDLGLDYAGAIDFDNAVWQSVRNRQPVLVAQPFTHLAGQFLGICKHLIAPEEMRAVG